jgi:hypothetical protein
MILNRIDQIAKIFFILTFSFILGCNSGSDDITLGGQNDEEEVSDDSDSGSVSSTDGSIDSGSSSSSTGRQWTVSEILAEPRRGGAGGTPKCGGEGGFKRCLCPEDVPAGIVYRPAVTECNGDAAAILFGEYEDIFSIVVRDTQNRDRWPEAGSGYGGCSADLANSSSPPNRCSAFKVQDKFATPDGNATVHCFGESGYSEIFSDVSRLTIKFDDDPFSSDDTIGRYCISGPEEPLN